MLSRGFIFKWGHTDDLLRLAGLLGLPLLPAEPTVAQHFDVGLYLTWCGAVKPLGQISRDQEVTLPGNAESRDHPLPGR